MPYAQPSRVRETTPTTSTGTYALAGAVVGYRTFGAALSNGDTVDYTVVMGSNWEIGRGTYSANTLTRDVIYASSNSDNAVSWGSGTKDIFCGPVGMTDLDATGILNYQSLMDFEIGTDIQAWDPNLDDISALTTTAAGLSVLEIADPGADRIIFWDDSAGVMEVLALSTGLSISSTTLSLHARLVDIAGLTATDNGVIIGNGSNFVVESGATLKTSLGLTIGTDIQAYDAELAAIAGLTSAADRVPYFTGSGTAALGTFTSYGRSVVAVADEAAFKALVNLEIGTDVQAYDAALANIAGQSIAAGTMLYGSGTDAFSTLTSTAAGRSVLTYVDPNADRILFWDDSGGAFTGLSLDTGLSISSTTLSLEAGLAAIAGLSKTDSNIIVGNGSTWVAESGATARTSLGVAIGSDVQAYDADLAAVAALTTTAAGLSILTYTDPNSDRIIFWDDSGGAMTGLALDTGLSISSTTLSLEAGLAAIAGLSKTDGNIIVGNGSTWVAESGATARTSLGLGTGDAVQFAGITGTTLNLTSILTLTSVQPLIDLNESDAGADEKAWRVTVANDSMFIMLLTDALGGAVTADQWTRVGTTVTKRTISATEFEVNATTFDFNGSGDISGDWAVLGAIAVTGDWDTNGATAGITIRDAANFFIRTSTTSVANVDHISIHNTNGQVGSARSNASGSSWVTTSDERLKDFIDGYFDPEKAIEAILADPVRHWHWKNGGHYDVGWGAQTSYKVAERLGLPTFDFASEGIGEPGDDDFSPWGMAQGDRTPYLWAATTALIHKIAALETEVANLNQRFGSRAA